MGVIVPLLFVGFCFSESPIGPNRGAHWVRAQRDRLPELRRNTLLGPCSPALVRNRTRRKNRAAVLFASSNQYLWSRPGDGGELYGGCYCDIAVRCESAQKEPARSDTMDQLGKAARRPST